MQLEDDFKRELDFSRRSSCPGQFSGYASWRAISKEDVRIVWGDRGREVRAIEDIEHFRTELNVKSLGNLADIVVLEYRKISFYQTG